MRGGVGEGETGGAVEVGGADELFSEEEGFVCRDEGEERVGEKGY